MLSQINHRFEREIKTLKLTNKAGLTIKYI